MPEDNTTTSSTPMQNSTTPVLPTVASDAIPSPQSPPDPVPAVPPVPQDSTTSTMPTDSPSDTTSIIDQTPMSSVVVDPTAPPEGVDSAPAPAPATPSIYDEVANKIRESKNVLIALSSDPSVDEMAAAIGLSIYLDRLDKRATAIYSGSTPNALEFLKPEETFEPSADTLQDFVIALNKEKADHLRYKLDGDYVKIYITPYKARIAEENLEFSYGDYNVDLVIALDVANGVDLDSALREHGRIMHDAVIINVTTGNPGKFGEIEWSEKASSSISEMIARLIFSEGGSAKLGKEEATAFLTGIVAATNRFSNSSTTPETMKIASTLMEYGANQQLVSKNITPDVENEILSLSGADNQPNHSNENTDPTKLEIEHNKEDEDNHSSDSSESSESEAESKEEADESKEISADINEKEDTLLEDLKAAEASLSHAGAETTAEPTEAPLEIKNSNEKDSSLLEVQDDPAKLESEPKPEESESKLESEQESTPSLEAPEQEASSTPSDSEPKTEPTLEPIMTPEPMPSVGAKSEAPSPLSESNLLESPDKLQQTKKNIEPPAGFEETPSNGENSNKFGQMLEDALSDANIPEPISSPITSPPETNVNPAAMGAPVVPNSPETNGVPEINYMPNGEILPPPPAPPIEISQSPMPSIPNIPEPTASMPSTPAPAPQPSSSPAANTDPAAFKIPGM